MLARLLAVILGLLTPTLHLVRVRAPLLALLAPSASIALLVAEAPSVVVAASTAAILLQPGMTPVAPVALAATLASAYTCLRRGLEPLVEALKRRPTPLRLPHPPLAAAGLLLEAILLLAVPTPSQLLVAVASTPITLLATCYAPRRPPPHVAAAYVLALAASPITPAYALALMVDAAPSVEQGLYPVARARAILSYRPARPYMPTVHHKTKWWWLSLQPGTMYHHPHEGAINPHVVVMGATGSGKSRAAAAISARMAAATDATILVIDPHGEYKHLLETHGLQAVVIDASSHGVNPLELLPGETPRTRTRQIVDLIALQYPIGPLQASILENALLNAYIDAGLDPDTPYQGDTVDWPTLDKAARYIAEESLAGSKSARSLTYYVSDFIGKLGGARLSLNDIAAKNTIIDLHRIGSRGVKTLYVDTLLRILLHYYTSLGVTEGLRKVIVVDEAHMFYPRGRYRSESTLSLMVRELRKYGVAVIIVTQTPMDLEREVIDNAATMITLTQTEPRILEYTARLLAAYRVEDRVEAVKLLLHELPRGSAILRTHALPYPVVIEFS